MVYNITVALEKSFSRKNDESFKNHFLKISIKIDIKV